MKKQFYPLLLIVVISLFTLAACGGGGAERLPQENEEPAPAPAQEEAVATTGDATKGQDLFVKTCSACHGPAGEGVQGLGKDMTTSEFIASKSDAELVAFLKVGRDPSDPLNTTGVAMPPKGGNPALSEEDLQHLVAFIRSIHQ